MKTTTSIYRIHRVPPYDVKPWHVVAAVLAIGALWSFMVLGSVLVARHAWYAVMSGACQHYGPRVDHGPARVTYYPPDSRDLPLTWAVPPQ